MPNLWIRHETRQTERRTPVTPDDARRLVAAGAAVTVEESAGRVFPTADYAVAGCAVAPSGSWADAPTDVVIVGLKELPPLPVALRHRHVYFGHAYKRQDGARELLGRFAAGTGTLLDIEYLVEDGRRLAAFGYWAGYVGAALAVLRWRGELTEPLRPFARADLDAHLAAGAGQATPSVLVLGALGRCGRGAQAALAVAGITPTLWDVAETRELDRAALLGHDILVNAVLATKPIPPFVTHADIDGPARRLSVICDVTCDVTSDCNTLPIYDRITTWPEPAARLRSDHPLDLIAIDNLPSLLPQEASVAFSAELTPHLLTLDDPGSAWRHCVAAFRQACREAGIEGSYTHA